MPLSLIYKRLRMCVLSMTMSVCVSSSELFSIVEYDALEITGNGNSVQKLTDGSAFCEYLGHAFWAKIVKLYHFLTSFKFHVCGVANANLHRDCHSENPYETWHIGILPPDAYHVHF